MVTGGDDNLYGRFDTDAAIFDYDCEDCIVTAGANLHSDLATVEYIGDGTGDGFDTFASVKTLRFADGGMILERVVP